MGAAGAEIADHAPLRRAHDAVGFGGDQRLVVDLQQNGRFDDLRLDQRRDHRHHRRVGIHHRALAQRVEVAGEAEMAQVVEEALVKNALRAQKGYVVLGKVQAADVLHHLRQPREDGEAAVVGVFAVKHVERDTRVAHPVAEIAVGHGQLVKVHHHGKVSLPVLLEHNASPEVYRL